MVACPPVRWLVLLVGIATATSAVRAADEKPRLLQLPALRDGLVTEVLVQEGQKVEKGAILARLDDRLARMDYETAATRIKSVQAQVEITQVELADAQRSLELLKKPQRGVTGLDQMRLEELRLKRAEADLASRKALLRVAELELQRAALIVDLHVIRSPQAGTVLAILKRPGEGAKYLETVMQLQPEGR